MKTEIVNVPGKGVCILISEIDVNDFIQGVNSIPTLQTNGSPFSNVHLIADFIRKGQKIGAIKEVRQQTGWGLREAKEYLDRFMDTSYTYRMSAGEQMDVNERSAEHFIRHHTIRDFFDEEDFKV